MAYQAILPTVNTYGMLPRCMVSREVSTLFVLVASGEARGVGLQNRRGGKINILKENNATFCAQKC